MPLFGSVKLIKWIIHTLKGVNETRNLCSALKIKNGLIS